MKVCPFDGCDTPIGESLFCCQKHWFRLSAEQRERIEEIYGRFTSGAAKINDVLAVQIAVLNEAQGKAEEDPVESKPHRKRTRQ